MSYADFYDSFVAGPRDKARKCNTHAICISSDSGLPECKCWCAECKESKNEVINTVRSWA